MAETERLTRVENEAEDEVESHKRVQRNQDRDTTTRPNSNKRQKIDIRDWLCRDKQHQEQRDEGPGVD